MQMEGVGAKVEVGFRVFQAEGWPGSGKEEGEPRRGPVGPKKKLGFTL